jgi:hypothetical protein
VIVEHNTIHSVEADTSREPYVKSRDRRMYSDPGQGLGSDDRLERDLSAGSLDRVVIRDLEIPAELAEELRTRIGNSSGVFRTTANSCSDN